MSERDDLAVRAEVLSKLADQLGEQLAVERKANDELRTILREGPTSPGFPRGEEGVAVAPVATTLAAVAVGMSICAAVAASWIGTGTGSTCHARQASFVAGTSAIASSTGAIVSPRPVTWTVGAVHAPVAETPPPSQTGIGPNPRDCGRIVNATAARCFVDATGGDASGEYMLRNLVLAYTLLGDRTRAGELAKRYFREYGSSPFTLQIHQLGY